MLRFKILTSAVPLIVAAVFARGEFSTSSRPCIATGGASVQITSLAWQAQRQVSFTTDPSTATVRIQLSENAGAADFAVVDDVDSAEDGVCAANAATRFVAISASPPLSAPVIYLSPDGPADYRIFVHSTRFTARDAAALVVGASGIPSRLAAASL